MATTLRQSGWSPTALPHVDSQTVLGTASRTFDPKFYAVHPGAYDGQFYWGIAIDPLATNTLHRGFDKPSYRYGHPLYGWLGWLFSFGTARAVPAVLAGLGLASMFAAAAAATALGISRGTRGWEGLLVAVSPGLIFAVRGDLAEPLGVALLLGGFAALGRDRRTLAWICFALLPLAKEPLILATLSVIAWELLQRRWRSAAIFATALAPALTWWTWARIHLGAWFTSGGSALAPPLAGWQQSLEENLDGNSALVTHVHAGRLTAAALLVLVVLVGFVGAKTLRLRGPLDLAALAFTVLAICLAGNATTAFTSALRNTAFLFALAPFVLVAAVEPRIQRQREAAHSAAGLDELADVDHDDVEAPAFEHTGDPGRARRHDDG
jgi:MFS family permease